MIVADYEGATIVVRRHVRRRRPVAVVDRATAGRRLTGRSEVLGGGRGRTTEADPQKNTTAQCFPFDFES